MIEFLYFLEYSLYACKIFLLVLNLLTLTFDQFFKKIDISQNLQIVLSWDKIFLLVSKYSSIWSWPS